MEQNNLGYIDGQDELLSLEQMSASSCCGDTYIIHDNVANIKELLIELHNYKQLEEEIGCPLDIVIRALKDGFYVDKEQVEKEPTWENNKGLVQIGCPKYFKLNLWYKTIEVDREGHYLEIELSDYKKTWWLKADRSE